LVTKQILEGDYLEVLTLLPLALQVVLLVEVAAMCLEHQLQNNRAEDCLEAQTLEGLDQQTLERSDQHPEAHRRLERSKSQADCLEARTPATLLVPVVEDCLGLEQQVGSVPRACRMEPAERSFSRWRVPRR